MFFFDESQVVSQIALLSVNKRTHTYGLRVKYLQLLHVFGQSFAKPGILSQKYRLPAQ